MSSSFGYDGIKNFMEKFKKNKYDAPSSSAIIKTCSLCVEPGATKRPCCNALFCDHCYVKNARCPNCDVYTKQEKLTGATYQVKVFSEHEECRVCLEPGLKRRCCSNYYCDTCYYKVTTCRSCGLPVGHQAEEKHKLSGAKCLTVLLGWMITVFFVVIFVTFFLVVIVAEAETPKGLFGYRCHGFFRHCDFHVCVDMDYSVASAAALPPLSGWAKCTLNSVAKLESRACIYDHQLYSQSNKLLGYDLCSAEFNNGVYIFEDTFENWSNESFSSNAMKSAVWGTIVNAYASDYCGAGEKFGYTHSLSFQGPDERYAETIDMDVSSGGKVEMELFFPPISYSAFSEHCKAGFIGNVFIQYSINGGVNYTDMIEYDPRYSRQSTFFPVSLEIPEEAQTTSTRFRIIQPVFVDANDNFAVDNVRVLKYLPKKWSLSGAFEKSMKTARSIIQKAQCCVDTDWCGQRQSLKESNHCPIDFPLWYKGKHYLIRLQEVLICIAFALLIIKLIYNSVSEYLIYGRIPLQDELLEMFQLKAVKEWMKAHVPLKYRFKVLQYLENNNDNISKIHASARLEENLRHEFNDEEGVGELVKRKSVIEAEEKELKKKIKKLKKRLDARMKNKNFKVSPAIDSADTAYDTYMKKVNAAARGEETEDDLPITNTLTAANSGAGGGASGMFFEGNDSKFDDIKVLTDDDLMPENKEVLMSDLDRVRRSNFSMLRIPFYHDVDEKLLNYFFYITTIAFAAVFISLLAVSTNYTIHEPLVVFGIYKTDFNMDAVLIILFGTALDFHSIFHVMKHNIPVRKNWLPMITIDLSEEVRCLFIGHHTIRIEDIQEIQAFPKSYAQVVFVGYLLGVFPWCMLSLLLRQATLNYASMRIVTPFLGSIFIIRAVLGPSFVIKCYYCIEYLLTLHFSVREQMGAAFQSTNTFNTIYNTILTLLIISMFLCGLFAYTWLPVVFACAVMFGVVYGGFTGCIHALPIKPWMAMTIIRGGVWMTLKKKQLCPCIYWCKYCTDMHNYEERFVVFTTDDLRFVSLINGGINGVNA